MSGGGVDAVVRWECCDCVGLMRRSLVEEKVASENWWSGRGATCKCGDRTVGCRVSVVQVVCALGRRYGLRACGHIGPGWWVGNVYQHLQGW